MTQSESTRRTFLHDTLAGAAAAGLIGAGRADEAAGLPTRPLGKTGVRVSMMCLGGWHVGSIKDERTAVKLMHAAIAGGMTFFDNAWDYHDGRSEELMGKALAEDGKRKQVFLMTKVCARDARGVRQQLEESLRRLRTDVIDLWQFHETNYDNDPDWVVEQGGLGEALKARQEGKVRFLGFTGHKSPHIHLKMLEKHAWDAVQLPINACDHYYRSFAHQVLPRAAERQVGAIGMKSLGGGADGKGRFVAARVCTAEEGRLFALSQPIASLVVGIDSMEILEQDLKIGRTFQKLKPEQIEAMRQAVLAKVKPVAGDGRHERFKSTQFFDGPYHQKQHGLTEKDVQGG